MKFNFLRTTLLAVLFSVTAEYSGQAPVVIPPTIILGPASQTVCAGNAASFSVIAAGTSLTYQWRKGAVNLVNGGTISGATSATLLISSVSFTDASNNYNVLVSGACAPTATSSNASLVVNSPPAIITAPCTQTVCEGGSVSFPVTATGTGLTYQWRRGIVNLVNGGNISGVNTATLLISPVSYTDASNDYNVVISGACPPVVGSAYISLLVTGSPAIVGNPSSQTVCAGSSASFSVAASGSGLTYQWRNGTTNLINSGTTSGVNTATLLISAASFTDASNNYNVVVSGACSTATSSNASLVVNSAPAIITAPCTQTVCEGGSVSFPVTATGTGLTYQWRRGIVNLVNGGTISGVNTATLLISSVSFTDASNDYNVVISGACPPVIGSVYISLLVTGSPAIVGNPSSQTVCAGSPASFSVAASGSGLTYQWRNGTTNLANSGTTSGVNTAILLISAASFTDASNNYNVVVSGACSTATSSNASLVVNSAPAIITAPCTQTVCEGGSVSFPVTATGTGLTYQWRRGIVNLVNGGTISGVNTATLLISSVSFTDASNDYNVVISGACPPVVGSAYISLVVDSQPIITAVSPSQTVCAGSPVSFSVLASGSGLSYQWRNGLVNLVNAGTASGVNTATLLISAASFTDASNNYNVVITGACAPTQTSSNISLVVDSQPTITAVSPSQTVCAGSPVSFTVLASGSSLTYQWRNGVTNLTNSGTTSGVNTATLLIGAASFTDASNNYNVVVTGACAPTQTSSNISLVVDSQPTITAVSASQTVCAGSPVSFSVLASGNGLTYQWRNGLVNLVNAGTTSGVNTATLLISAASFTDTSNSYNVVVTGACAPSATSSNISLVVDSQPIITAVSPSQTVCAGSPVSFSVLASGSGLTYQWRNGTTNLINSGTTSGVNTATLLISAASFTDASNNYNVVVSGGACSSATSTNISLVVDSQPTITAVSSSQTVCAGSPVTFSILVSGSGLTYQWRNGVTNLTNSGTTSGVNTATLMISAASFTNASSNYNVVVTGACAPSATSSNISLVVDSQPTITAVSASQTICAGSPVSFSVLASGSGLSYQWRNGAVNLVNAGTISGVNTTTLLISAASFTDASNNYNVVVSGGACSSATSTNISLVVDSQPTITAVSSSQTVCAGSPVSFSVAATGNGLSYQWRNGVMNLINSGNTSGVNTTTLLISAASFTDASNNYNVVVSGGACSSATSTNISLVVDSQPTITAVSSSQTVCAGSPLSFSVAASGSGLSYQWMNGAVNLVNGGTTSGVNTATLLISAASFTDASSNYNVVVSGACAPSATSANISLVVDSQPTITAVSPSQTVCEGSPVSFSVTVTGNGLSYQWRNGTTNLFNGGTISGVNSATLLISSASFTDASNNYNVVVSGACSSTVTSSAIALVVNKAPAITSAPCSLTICAGSTAVFTVSAIGDGLSYQWRNGVTNLVNGGTISGANSATLLISAASYTDQSNNYNVVVSGVCPPIVASAYMSLVISPSPSLAAQVPSQTVCVGSPVVFNVSPSVPGFTYQWRIGTTNLINGGTISGATSATLSINPVQASDSSANYNVVITNACAASYTSGNINLHVNEGLTARPGSNSPVCTGSVITLTVQDLKDATYTWTGPNGFASNEQNPVISSASAEKAGTYSLAVSSNSCASAVSTLIVEIKKCFDSEFFIPDAFSPNTDGINDLFVIRGITNYPDNHFIVFNRWGNKVFEANGYKSTWNGTTTEGINVAGNELPVGTYFYVLELGEGSPFYKGTIYLNR